jgi:hypothetical protein
MLRRKAGAAVTVAQRTGASQAFMAMNTFLHVSRCSPSARITPTWRSASTREM